MKEEADILIDWCERAIRHHTKQPAPDIGEVCWNPPEDPTCRLTGWHDRPLETWEQQVEYMMDNNPPEQQKALFDYLQPESTEFRFLDSGFQRFVFTDGECVVKVPIYWHSQEIDCTQDANQIHWEDWVYGYMEANHSGLTHFYLKAETFGYEGIVKMPIVTTYEGDREPYNGSSLLTGKTALFNDEWRYLQYDDSSIIQSRDLKRRYTPVTKNWDWLELFLLDNIDDTTNNYAIHDGQLVCIDYWTTNRSCGR